MTDFPPVRMNWVRGLEAVEALVGWDYLTEAWTTPVPFVSRKWCMAWYEAYADLYEPAVLELRDPAGRLVGIAPMAVDHAGHRLLFAGEPFGEYRQVLVGAAYRRKAFSELFRFYQEHRFRNPLVISVRGEQQEHFDLPSTLQAVAGPYLRVQQLQTYVWRASQATRENDPLQGRSLIAKRRQLEKLVGPVRLILAGTPKEWNRWKDEFFTLHSLRQIQLGREPSFQSARKQRFFEKIVLSGVAHFVVLAAGDDQMLAGHLGHFGARTIYLGAPAFALRYHRQSPGLLTLAMLAAHAPYWGFDTFDMTPGEDGQKRQMGTSRETVLCYTIYPTRGRCLRAKVRFAISGALRKAALCLLGEKSLQTATDVAAAGLTKLRRDGLASTLALAGRILANALWRRTRETLLEATPQSLGSGTPRLEPGGSLSIHRNREADFLLSAEPSDFRFIREAVQAYSQASASGHRLYTLLIDDQLAGWAFSHEAFGKHWISSIGPQPVPYPERSVSLHSFFILPRFRGRRLQQILYEYILRERFHEGANRAFCTILNANTPSFKNAVRAGFRPVRELRAWRILRWSQHRIVELH